MSGEVERRLEQADGLLYARGRLRQYFMAASHVLTPQRGQGMLHLQRHLLASDARDDIEIMYQQRHDRGWQVGKLILETPQRINTVCLSDRK